LTLGGNFSSHIFKCLDWVLVADAEVTALAVVEDFNVFKDYGLSMDAGSESLAMDQFNGGGPVLYSSI